MVLISNVRSHTSSCSCSCSLPSFYSSAGISVGQTVGRTIVVHDDAGTRVGCGVLKASTTAPSSIHPALVEHRVWLIFVVVILVMALLLQSVQIAATIYTASRKSDSFSSEPEPERPEPLVQRVMTKTLLLIVLLSWFFIAETTFHSMHRWGSDRKGEWSVVFLLITTIALLYGYMVGEN